MQVKAVREKDRELKSQEFEWIANITIIDQTNNMSSNRAVGEMIRTRTYDAR